MKYKIEKKYCWYNNRTEVVCVYFINSIPFTFNVLSEAESNDESIKELANKERQFNPEDMYLYSFYLIDEMCHPCIFELELENPEMMDEIEAYDYDS